MVDVAGQHLDEGGVLAGCPDGDRMGDQPQQDAGNPQPQSKTDRGGQRAIDDRHRARRTGEQDRFGQ